MKARIIKFIINRIDRGSGIFFLTFGMYLLAVAIAFGLAEVKGEGNHDDQTHRHIA